MEQGERKERRTLLQLYRAAFRARDGCTGLEGSQALSKRSWSGFLTLVGCLPHWQGSSISTVPGRFGTRRVVGSS